MLNANPVGTKVSLGKPATATDLTLTLKSGEGARVAPGPGNHIWVTLRRGAKVERVKVIARNGDVLSLEGRGADGTSAQDWIAGDCVSVEWSPAMMCEYITACMASAPAPSGVTPGTYCLDRCTCLEVGTDGRIMKIDQGSSC